jgi:hypothetical protein
LLTQRLEKLRFLILPVGAQRNLLLRRSSSKSGKRRSLGDGRPREFFKAWAIYPPDGK